MDAYRTIHIVDRDGKRRAALAEELRGLGYRTEISGDLIELGAHACSEGIVFAHAEWDIGEIRRVLEEDCSFTVYHPVVLYAESPKIQDVTAAVIAGAIAFIDWPPSGQEFREQMEDIRERSIASHTQSLIEQ